MVQTIATTPLFALDCVALDLETTGLDPRQARVIEIGAVRLRHEGVSEDESFETLVSPGPGVEIGGKQVHGLDAAALEDAPSFVEAYAELRAFTGEAVVIGHTLGFDMAVLRREASLAGLPFEKPRMLDVRLLAEVLAPHLPDFSLDALAAWLFVELGPRHRAKGDAVSAGRVFAAMRERLRDIGIRTLGEAEEACRGRTEALERYHRAGWMEPTPDRDAARERSLQRIDPYPYRHRIGEAMRAPPLWIGRQSTVGECLSELARLRVSSLFVGEPGPAAAVGIVTERDVLRAIAASGPAVLGRSVDSIATRPLQTVPEEAFLYRAIGRMSALNIRHLGVVDERGHLVGALSQRDLLRLRAEAAFSLGDDIDRGADVGALGRAWAKLPAMAASLVAEDVPARTVAAVIAREVGALTRRCAELSEAATVSERGPVPARYCVLVLGSAGRGESLLAMDQDNALIVADDAPAGADAWFAAFGERLAHMLHQVGVPLCPGKVMASNPAFRGSLHAWKERFAGWVRRADPADLLNVDILFDLRPVHGAGDLAAELSAAALAAARGEVAFLKLLLEMHTRNETALTVFGSFRLEDGRLDLKRHGLGRIVAAARAMALARGVPARSTAARIAAVRAEGMGSEADLAILDEAHAFVLELILQAQLADIAAGRPPGNKIQPGALNANDRVRLKNLLAHLQSIDDFARGWMSSAMARARAVDALT